MVARDAISLAVGIGLGLAAALVLAMASPAGPSGVMHALVLVVTRPRLLEQAVLISAPIAASAIGLALAYRARFITIGSEGQVLLGALVALGLTAYTSLGVFTLPTVFLLSAISGSLLGLIVGLLRLLGVNEVLTSLMLNYVIMYIANYLVAGPWRQGAFTMTKSVPPDYRVSAAHVLLVLAGLAVAYELLLRRTSLGYSIEALGSAPRAATTYGIRWRRTIIAVSALSGAAAGIGGALMMLGFQYSFTALSTPPGYGYMGILVSWISLLDPLVSLGTAFVFALMSVSVRLLQAAGVSFGFTLALQAVVVLVTTTTTMVLRRRRRRW